MKALLQVTRVNGSVLMFYVWAPCLPGAERCHVFVTPAWGSRLWKLLLSAFLGSAGASGPLFSEQEGQCWAQDSSQDVLGDFRKCPVRMTMQLALQGGGATRGVRELGGVPVWLQHPGS